jgi:hypothetical protein
LLLPYEARSGSNDAVINDNHSVSLLVLSNGFVSLHLQWTATLIPLGAGADWYTREVGGAAAREINERPTGIPPLQGSMIVPVGMSAINIRPAGS